MATVSVNRKNPALISVFADMTEFSDPSVGVYSKYIFKGTLEAKSSAIGLALGTPLRSAGPKVICGTGA